MILAAGGLLAGRKATTKQQVTPPERSPIELMQQNYPDITVVAASVVDDGITTGGGVSLCIDAMLYLLERELGSGVARETARLLEYTRAWNANGQELPVLVTGRAGS
jgi:transcriptional regulator GlxA family with amidase domain